MVSVKSVKMPSLEAETCHGCNQDFTPAQLTCVGSAQATDKCELTHDCSEVYCDDCWEDE